MCRFEFIVSYQLIFWIICLAAGSNEVRVGAPVRGSATLPCPIKPEKDDDSLLLVLWYKDGGGNSPIYSYDARMKNGVATKWSSDQAFGKRAYFMTSVDPAGLLIANISPKDEGIYVCRTDFRNSPTKHWKIVLDVLIPPGTPKIFDGGGEIDSIAGPYNQGAIVEFNCTVDGGKPSPTISWYYNDVLIYSSDQGGRPGNNVRIRLLKQDDGAVLSCVAQNSNLTEPSRKSFRVEMLLPPFSTTILESGQPLSAGREYEFVCQSIGSKPPAEITWWKDEEQLLKTAQTEEKGLVTSRLKFTPSWEDDGKSLECRATNMSMEDEVLEDIIELKVFYAPVLNVVMQQREIDLKEEMDAQLQCQHQSNPEITVVEWLKDGLPLTPDSDRVTTADFLLVFRNISRSDSGQYACAARNQEGVSTSPTYNLQVMHRPYCRNNSTVFKIMSQSPLSLVCQVTSNPLPLSFIWINNSTGKVLQQSKQDGSSSTVVINPASFDYSETVACYATNELGRQREPCFFHIVYEGPPAKPTNCSLSQPHPSVYVLACSPPYRHEPDYYALQVFDLDTNIVTFNITSSLPQFTLVVKEPTNFVISDLQFHNIVTLSRKRTMCRMFGVNQFGVSESVDMFVNEEGAAHLKQEDSSSEIITQAVIVSCICLGAALIVGILLLLLLKRLFKTKKRRAAAAAEIKDKDLNQLNIPLCSSHVPEPVVHKYKLPNETEL